MLVIEDEARLASVRTVQVCGMKAGMALSATVTVPEEVVDEIQAPRGRVLGRDLSGSEIGGQLSARYAATAERTAAKAERHCVLVSVAS